MFSYKYSHIGFYFNIYLLEDDCSVFQFS